MENKKHGHIRFYEILEELANLHNLKNQDYADNENPLQNFQRTAELCKGFITRRNQPLKMALSFMAKQIDAVYKLVGQGQTGKAESISDRLRDIAIYSILSMILLEEKFEKKSVFSLFQRFWRLICPKK